MSLREEIKDIFIYEFEQYGVNIGENADEYTIKVIKEIETRIDEKIRYVNEVLNDSRLTIQGCQRLKGKKDAYEEVKEMLK